MTAPDPLAGALVRLRGWIGAYAPRFFPPPGDALLAARAEPFVELCLVLYALSAPGRDGAAGPLQGWARALAGELGEAAFASAGRIPWRDLPSRSARHPQALLPLLAFPVLEAVTGRASGVAACIARLLELPLSEAQRRCYTGDLSFAFLADVLGRPGAADRLSRQALAVLERLRGEANPRTSPLYDLTHAVFYATRFGRRGPEVLGPHSDWLRERLGGWALERVRRADYDLGAELLLSGLYVGAPGERARTAARLLAGAVPEDGAIPPPGGSRIEGKDPFETHYHCVLVTLAALGRYAAAPGRPPSAASGAAIPPD